MLVPPVMLAWAVVIASPRSGPGSARAVDGILLLGKLEGNVAAMTHDLGADLYRPLPRIGH